MPPHPSGEAGRPFREGNAVGVRGLLGVVSYHAVGRDYQPKRHERKGETVRINWKRFAFVFLLLQVVCFTAAFPAACWAPLSAMFPSFEPLVPAAFSLVAPLSGPPLSPPITA